MLWCVGISSMAMILSRSEPPLETPLNLQCREIGPAVSGGRIDDIAVGSTASSAIFVATAAGGIFRSSNNGVTWEPVFDDSESSLLSVGAVAVAPSDPNIVWAGTGEANNRQSSSWGDGVYKSLDGGTHWTYMGLRDTQHIGRIVIHPRDANIVYVAALGHLWGPNKDRGLYRTKDGGRSWEKVLEVDQDTGVVDVSINSDGRTLLAATYQRRRRAWGFVGGGPGSGLYRSLDGGDTWRRASGLPDGPIGRIGVAMAPSNPEIAYAIVEHSQGGVFRSTDGGNSWTRQSGLRPRPMYYGQIRVEPQDPDKVWVLGPTLYRSIDAGRTFESGIGGDHHALWIDPKLPAHLLLGSDSGLNVSYDNGRNWQFVAKLPIAQFYNLTVDQRDPYWIYGGTQDNGSWAMPSRNYKRRGISNFDFIKIASGDGFYTAVSPDGSDLYGSSQDGQPYLLNLQNKQEKAIKPVPAIATEEYRFNWNTPMELSPHDHSTLYYGAQKLFRSKDKGNTWEVISPDLTKSQNWKKLPMGMGEPREDTTIALNDGITYYGTITTISESPLVSGLIYAGTDDGNLQLTRDSGKTWHNLTDGLHMPGSIWVSRVLSSRLVRGRAFVSLDGHRDDDYSPYLFVTDDEGATWKSIVGNLPTDTVVESIEEDPQNASLLAIGTESGLYITRNRGQSWERPHGVPRAPITSVIIHPRERDLILGTHGRGVVIADDIIMLEEEEKKPAESSSLFRIRRATEYIEDQTPPIRGDFSAPNPDYGAVITYRIARELGANAGEPVKNSDASLNPAKLVISDSSGTVCRELSGPGTVGVHRLAWNLRCQLQFEVQATDDAWYGPPLGPFARPGIYEVKLVGPADEQKERLEVRLDPRITVDAQSIDRRWTYVQHLCTMLKTIDDARRVFRGVNQDLSYFEKLLEGRQNSEASTTFFRLVQKNAKTIENRVSELAYSIIDLYEQVEHSFAPLTEAQHRSLEFLSEALNTQLEALDSLKSNELSKLRMRVISP